MKASRWILAADIFWAVVLLVVFGMWLFGDLPWYRAATPLAPFGIYLACSRVAFRAAGRSAPGTGAARGRTAR